MAGWIDWEALQNITAGALTSMGGTIAGRLMHHSTRRGRGAKIKLVDIAWDAPVVVGMALVNYGLADWFDLKVPAAIALATGLGYMGPRAINMLLDQFIARYGSRIDKSEL